MPPRIHRQYIRVLVVLMAGVALLQSPVAAQAPAPSGKGFIWRLEKDGRTGWLVGSLHVLAPDFYPLPQSMTQAFHRSATLVEETDLAEMTSPETLMLLASRSMYTDGETLKSQLAPDTYRITTERIGKLGMPMEPLERMKPWMIAILLLGAELQRAGFNPELGVDKHFFNEATRIGKPRRSLETVAEQLELFAGLTAKTQEALLRDTLNSIETEIGQVATIAKAWKAGDAATIERLLLESMKNEPAIYQSMIVNRNRSWVPKIEACISDGDCFIVVGAAHLVGPDGLLKSLAANGYSIHQQ